MHIEDSTRREWLVGCAAAGITAALALPAVADEETEKLTARRLKMLRTCESLTAAFRYFGDQDKPFYQITYHLGDFAAAGDNSFDRVTKLDRDAMLKLLDALAKDGFIATAGDISTKDIKPAVGYSLTLTAKKKDGGAEFKELGWQSINGNGHVELYRPLGWDLKMIERLEALRPALDGEAAKDMDFLLGRLTGLKQQWQKGK
ncbi:hypothetical protein [Anatilimnocola floriformis]|uniref:hypothetical protein n=1 Tax=Anatilimnocola floriformis TaxID=2948575 RepID=UPI0020C332BE|nr:hypothetical protein [Anatilimnocola floriformis]